MIKEAAGTPSPPPTSAGDPEPKRSLGFEGVFKRRQAASEDSTALAPEAATPPQDEDLLERLFDSSPDIPDEDPLVEKVEESAPIWADLEPPSPSVGDEPRPIFEEESTFSLADPEPIDWSANPLGETSADTGESLAPSWAGWSPLEEPAGETESLLRPGYLPDSDGDQASPSLRSRPASPASEPSSGMVEAVEVLVRAVAAGALSESQLNAITDLVRAVAAASRPTPPTY